MLPEIYKICNVTCDNVIHIYILCIQLSGTLTRAVIFTLVMLESYLQMARCLRNRVKHRTGNSVVRLVVEPELLTDFYACPTLFTPNRARQGALSRLMSGGFEVSRSQLL